MPSERGSLSLSVLCAAYLCSLVNIIGRGKVMSYLRYIIHIIYHYIYYLLRNVLHCHSD